LAAINNIPVLYYLNSHISFCIVLLEVRSSKLPCCYQNYPFCAVRTLARNEHAFSLGKFLQYPQIY